MATQINGSSATIPDPLCDLDRLAHAMEARGLDGLVITTSLNVTYLSGFNPTAPKADEPPGNAVVLSRHDLQHPILIAPDVFLTPFLDAPIWIEDLRPHRSVLLPVSVPTEPSVFNKFVPMSQRDAAWVKRARDTFAGGRHTSRCSLRPPPPGTQAPVVYAPSISRRDKTRSIKGRMPSSLEMASDLSGKEFALERLITLTLNQHVGVVAAGPAPLAPGVPYLAETSY